MAEHKIVKPKITKPSQLIINGEKVKKLGKKVKLMDHGMNMSDVVAKHLRSKGAKNP